jgi:hypothetical protein
LFKRFPHLSPTLLAPLQELLCVTVRPELHVIELDSTTPSKFSRHLVVQLRRRWAHAGHVHCFVGHLLARLQRRARHKQAAAAAAGNAEAEQKPVKPTPDEQAAAAMAAEGEGPQHAGNLTAHQQVAAVAVAVQGQQWNVGPSGPHQRRDQQLAAAGTHQCQHQACTELQHHASVAAVQSEGAPSPPPHHQQQQQQQQQLQEAALSSCQPQEAALDTTSSCALASEHHTPVSAQKLPAGASYSAFWVRKAATSATTDTSIASGEAGKLAFLPIIE